MICSNRASDLLKKPEQHPSSSSSSSYSMKGSRQGNNTLGRRNGDGVGSGGDGSSTRSCLVLPGYLTKDKKRNRQRGRNRGSGSNFGGGLMLQSSHSTESASQQSQNVNDRSSLLPPGGHSNMNIHKQRLLWMSEENDDDDKSEDVDPFKISKSTPTAGSAVVTPPTAKTTGGFTTKTNNQTMSLSKTNGPLTPTQPHSASFETPNNSGEGTHAGGGSGNIGLLAFPTPQDRSHKQRLAFEKESRRKAVYDGELEPEGVRGEEAQYTPSTKASSSPESLPLRSFDKGTPQGNGGIAVVNTSHGSTAPTSILSVTPSPARSTLTDERSAGTPGRRGRLGKPVKFVKSPSELSSTSSQDIAQMMNDFVNERETGNEQQHSILNMATPKPSSTTTTAVKATKGDKSSAPIPRLAPPRADAPSQLQSHQRQQNSRSARGVSNVTPRSHAHSLMEATTPALSQSHRPGTTTHTQAHKQQQGLRPITPPRSRSRPSTPEVQQRLLAAQQVYQGIHEDDSNSEQQRHTASSGSHNENNTRPPPRRAASSSGSTTSSVSASSFPPLHESQVEKSAPHGSDVESVDESSSFRRSAPVDIDDSSFVHPNENVEGINAMAIEHVMKGEYDMALHAFGQVLQVYQREFGGGGTTGSGDGSIGNNHRVVAHPLVASTYHNLGTVHSKRAMLFLENSLAQRTCRDQALLCFQAAARAARDSLGPTHPNVAVSLVRIGFLLLQARQYHNAVVTFEEALRIRVAHYGGGGGVADSDSIEPHALIANVYNNLGVCHMHLEEFDVGRRYLDRAVRMQQALMRTADGVSSEAFRTQLLELADTLCNIGGLCLEWIRKQGPDARHAMDAESSFLEALEIRTKVLGPKDPLVLQVRSLHDMVRAMPLPKATTERSAGASPSPGHGAAAFSNAGSASSGLHSYGGRVASPRPLPISPGRHRTGTSPGPSPARPGHQPSSRTDGRSVSSKGRENSGLDLPALKNNRGADNGTFSNPSEPTPPPKVVRRSLSPAHRDSGRDGRNDGYVTSTSRRGSDNEGDLSYSLTSPAFSPTPEPPSTTASRVERAKQVAPKDLTKVFLSPQFVPKTAPSADENDNGAFPIDKNRSFGSSNADVYGGDERVSESMYSYDPEENLVLSDRLGADGDPPSKRSGNDQDDNRDPFPWSQYSQLPKKTDEETSDVSTSILVVQPYDLRRQSEAKKKRYEELNSSNGAPSPPTHQYRDMTTSWSSTMSNAGTNSSPGADGDDDRMACLLRAKAILDAHSDFVDSPTLKLDATNTAYEPSPNEKRGDQLQQAPSEDFGNDDGLAPLGGMWPSPETPDSGNPHVVTSEMLDDPETHLRSIHICAVHYLKNNRMEESLQLFELVVDCQRLRNGALHEDVASALYNVGIANLRMEMTTKALQAFEESVRIRKGSLGMEHPLVAVSLVKVGITLLLLQRFEDSVWVFREALTVRKNALGALHPSTARIYNNLGCVHVEFNELREARRAFEAALDIQRNALSDDPQSGPLQFAAATTLCNLGYLYRNQEMHEKAALVLREALGLQENVMGKYDPAVLSTLDNLAEACSLSKHYTHAVKYYNEIMERFHRNNEIRFGANKRQKRAEAVLLYKMSRVHFAQQDYESQLVNLKLALRSIRAVSVSGNESPPEKEQREYLENHIQRDMRVARKQLEKSDIPPWV